MAYIEEFRSQLASRDYAKVLQLWQEYCHSDIADGDEIIEILQLIKQSDGAKHCGPYIEAIIPLIMQIEDEPKKDQALCLAFDLETTNTSALSEIALTFLKTRFGQDPLFNEKMRLVGLRSLENFQGALSNFFLLNHIQKNNFVLHTAGWGVGEIMDFSFLREQASIEFENPPGSKKDISFKNCFKTLLPIPKTHFLARRFADADNLEKESKENPIEVIKQLLQDLGPKTAAEIKDLVTDYVIPEKDYAKWWQQVRSKIKKDPLIEAPDNLKAPFFLRKGHASSEDRLHNAFVGKKHFQDILLAAQNLIRDYPDVLKDEQAKNQVVEKIKSLILEPNLPQAELLQALLFLEQPLGVTNQEESLKKIILNLTKIDDILKEIEILSLKRRLLASIAKYRKDWTDIFLSLLYTAEPNQLRDFILKELNTKETDQQLQKHLHDLLDHPKNHPEALFWYFQKILADEAPFFTSKEDKYLFFEALLILYSTLHYNPEYKDLAKKVYNLFTGKRFQLVRDFLKDAPISFAKEFLLLASKCHGFTDHDQKILHSLAEVSHPTLTKDRKQPAVDLHIIWTTREGYLRIQERIKHLGTVEIVENAKEIEAARALGDLRENSEYKFALERRSRLQGELKTLADQFRHARIITKDDISLDIVGIGITVELLNPRGEKITYTILGPLDANPDTSILSSQSKFVQAMLGKKVGDKFMFKGDEFKIVALSSYLEG